MMNHSRNIKYLLEREKKYKALNLKKYGKLDIFLLRISRKLSKKLLILFFYLEVIKKINKHIKTINGKIIINDHSSMKISKLLPKSQHCENIKNIQSTIEIIKITQKLSREFLDSIEKKSGIKSIKIISKYFSSYILHKKFIEKHNISSLITVDDIGSIRLGLLFAGHETNTKIALTRMTLLKGRYTPPLILHYLWCWSVNQKNELQQHNTKYISISPHQNFYFEKIRSEKIKIYLITNAFTSSKYISSLVQQLERNDNISYVGICLHPRISKNIIKSIKFREAKLENFTIEKILKADSQTIILAGNTSASLEILSSGKIVIYTKELDSSKYDLSGHVNSGLIKEISIKNLNPDYINETHDLRWRKLVESKLKHDDFIPCMTITECIRNMMYNEKEP